VVWPATATGSGSWLDQRVGGEATPGSGQLGTRQAGVLRVMTRFPAPRAGIGKDVCPMMSDASRANGRAGGASDTGAAAVDGSAAGAADPLPAAVAADETVAVALRRMLAAAELDLPLPGAGNTVGRWTALAGWGARDLSLARLAEGHVDALAILAEAGRVPVPGALYGVWASRSGGAAVRVEQRGDRATLRGELRFCSGARVLDRALVTVDRPSGASPDRVLVDVDVTDRRVHPVPESWCTAAMAAADTLDVVVDGVPVEPGDVVGEPGWYVARPGFALGGAGVAAVWWGGAAGIVDRVLGHLGSTSDPHKLAHLGEVHAGLTAADALLRRTAATVDAEPAADHALDVSTVRAAVERTVREVVDRAPRMVGPAPLSRDAGLARALADLALYVRQHHAERDHAALGEQVLDRWRSA
jgi:Acyl-CoA dehydrogenase, C-terminal domain